MRGKMCFVTAAGVLLGVATVASAQFASGFEDLDGSAEGIPLVPQDSWYIPVDGSLEYLVHTYDGNPLGISANPSGGAQFISGTSQATNLFARAQRDLSFAAEEWTFAYDINVTRRADPPAAQFAGSFSLQPSTTNAAFVQVMAWQDVNDPSSFDANYIAYEPGGREFAQPGQSPGAAFQGLALNTWYRIATRVDFATNRILSVTITDLGSGESSTAEPADWYLRGGKAGGLPLPTSFRFFTGGGNGNNTASWDNVEVAPAGKPECPIDFDGNGFADGGDFLAYLSFFFSGDDRADLDENGVIDGADFLSFLGLFFSPECAP